MKKKTKPPATSVISQPAVNDSSVETNLSAFSEDAKLFALVSLALDKHRLRVHDTSSGISSSEFIIETSTVTHLSWASLSLLPESPPTKKKRKKQRDNTSLPSDDPPQLSQLVMLGLRDGSILLFSPSHARVLSTLSSPLSSSPILSIAVSNDHHSLWISNDAGLILLWNVSQGAIIGRWKTDDPTPLSSLSLRSHERNDNNTALPQIAAAGNSIRILTLPESLDPASITPAQVDATLTGHASPVSIIRWDSSQTPPTRFISAAKGDRILSMWEIDEDNKKAQGKLVASIPLESYPRSASYTTNLSDKKHVLLAVDSTGKLFIFPIPVELFVPPSSAPTASKIPTIVPRTLINTVTSSSPRQASSSSPNSYIIDATFVPDSLGKVLVARLANGVKPIFDIISYLDDAGHYISEIPLEDISVQLLTKEERAIGIPTKRYAETSAAIRSANELALDEEMGDPDDKNVGGELDVNLAELSLGERLAAINRDRQDSGDASSSAESSSSSEGEEGDKAKAEGATSTSNRNKKKRNKEAANVSLSAVPASSLTRTLIQALHSSDTKLLEMCLAHSDPTLIRNTVRRLPAQLAVPLLNACVERLGRGSRAGSMKGRGGGASAQRGNTIVEWVRATLVVHSGHLMSLPDLVARLSKLHSTLTTRLALHESLVTLSGRLDMVLTQIELRKSSAPSVASGGGASNKGGLAMPSSKTFRYVEGESEDEDKGMEEDDDENENDDDVEMDDDDDAGSIEDVEFGGIDVEDDDEEEEEELDSGDDEDDEDEDGPTLNGFIDDEAEDEYSDDAEDVSDSEE